METIQRRVVCAAVKFQTEHGEMVIASPRHYDRTCVTMLKELRNHMAVVEVDQGFLDQFGEYMTREEAFIVASTANQIIRTCGSEHTGRLYSENLY